MQNKFLSAFILVITLLIYSCTSNVKSSTNQVSTVSKPHFKNDSIAEKTQCTFLINGKEFTLSEDDITVDYSLHDSTLHITFNKIESGFIVLHIPNIFKCPCTVPTGYSILSSNISFTQERVLQPTLSLQNYPIQGVGFQNLNDGFNTKKIEDGAATIFTVMPVGEDLQNKRNEYIIKGKIHTTTLKSVYESDAGEKNKNYRIEGNFVIKKIIYT